MKLTKEEQEIIKAHREKNQENLPYKIGYLNRTIYKWWGHEDYCKTYLSHSNNLDKQDFKDTINDFKSQFIQIRKGTKLYCYIVNGIEEWCDEDGHFDCEDSSWAEEFLEKIQICKKPRA